jgi:predicted membrane metal-binding protein
MNKDKINKSSNKSFGLVFFIFFFIISLYPLLKDGNIRIWALIIAIIFLILGLLNSKILSPLNKIWFKFGILLGKFVSPIVMGIVFFGVVTPTALIMKIFGKNLLGLKKTNKESYWIERPKIKSKMKNQF